MPNEAKNLMLLLGLLFIGPVIIARSMVSASWMQIGISYAIVFFAAAVLASGEPPNEKGGWFLLITTFFCLPGVPILALLLRTFKISA